MVKRAVLIFLLQYLTANFLSAKDLGVDIDAVRSLITQWNSAHTEDDIDDLLSLYASEVTFYGSSLTGIQCISKKRTQLEALPEYKQSINPDLSLTGYSSGVIRCDFVKTVYVNNKEKSYASYLVIKEVSGVYVIVGESDLITDDRVNYTPNLGTKVALKKAKLHKVQTDDSALYFVAFGLIIGFIGLWIAFKSKKAKKFSEKRVVRKQTASSSEDLPVSKYYEMGYEFEKFVVARLSKNKDFKLIEWRSDKFHLGIFPESNRNPDLEYRYQKGDTVRNFSIECKYRSRVFTGSIILMNENKYQVYEAFHRDKMPVYIVLGVGGGPEWPEELYLIPFQRLKTKMSYGELTKYLKRNDFTYNLVTDTLT